MEHRFHCKELRHHIAVSSSISNSDNKGDAVLYLCKSSGLTEASSHVLTLIRASAGISTPILQMRHSKAWQIFSDLCKIMHLIHGRGRTWTQVYLNSGCIPWKCSPNPDNPHIHKKAAPQFFPGFIPGVKWRWGRWVREAQGDQITNAL